MLRLLSSQHRVRRRYSMRLFQSILSRQRFEILGTLHIYASFPTIISPRVEHNIRSSSTTDNLADDFHQVQKKFSKMEKDEDIDGVILYFQKIRNTTTAHHLQVLEILGNNNLQKYREIILEIFES